MSTISCFVFVCQGSCFIYTDSGLDLSGLSVVTVTSCFFFSQIEEGLAMKDKKYNISVILRSCNIFSVTLLCSLLWYVYNFLTA